MMNEKALIPGDYYYIFGQVPPRRLSDVDIVANISSQVECVWLMHRGQLCVRADSTAVQPTRNMSHG